MAPRLLAPGTMLSGRYQLAEAIGESDISTVYAAIDMRSTARVALKVFEPGLRARAAALSEYQAQARQASALGVEGIARAYDFGIDGNTGVPFSTAEQIGWSSLDRRVAAHGPLGASELARALQVLSRALDAAHAAGIVHRDLKPQNVFISPDNPEWVRLTDFGMTAVRRGAPEAMGWGGPPGYTPADAVDESAPANSGVDLFALGVIAFFALTRGTPFRSLRSPGFDPNAHWAELNQPFGPLSERAKEIGVALDPAFDAWFARALSRLPQDRYASAGAMALELSAAAEQLSRRGGGPRSLPGIAAAIAQPLLFQPEPPAAAAPARASSPADVAAASRPEPASKLPLSIGAGVVLLTGLAFAGRALLGDRPAAEDTGALSSASATVAASPPAASAPTSAVAAPAASDSAAAAGPARARFSCRPEACDWVVCDGQNLTQLDSEIEVTPGKHDCSASKRGLGSKSLSFTALPGQLSEVIFELPPLPNAVQPRKAAAAAKPPASSPGAGAPALKDPALKPAAKGTASKPAGREPISKPVAKDPAAKSSTKKKCSTFLGCK